MLDCKVFYYWTCKISLGFSLDFMIILNLLLLKLFFKLINYNRWFSTQIIRFYFYLDSFESDQIVDLSSEKTITISIENYSYTSIIFNFLLIIRQGKNCHSRGEKKQLDFEQTGRLQTSNKRADHRLWEEKKRLLECNFSDLDSWGEAFDGWLEFYSDY